MEINEKATSIWHSGVAKYEKVCQKILKATPECPIGVAKLKSWAQNLATPAGPTSKMPAWPIAFKFALYGFDFVGSNPIVGSEVVRPGSDRSSF